MENIRQALKRAQELSTGRPRRLGEDPLNASPRYQTRQNIGIMEPAAPGREASQEIALNLRSLEANRIIAQDDTDARSRFFDILRTQVLQAMDEKNLKILGITSPSPACGKTVTSINLALSIARQPERSAFLVDMDLQKPQIANYLGIDCQDGLISVLEGRTDLWNASVMARAGKYGITVLPAEKPTSGSSAWMTSREMSTILQEIRRDYSSDTIIVDLPPMLASDDVIAILPQLDCILLVAAIGKTTVAEVEECNRYLQSTDVIRLVLNKIPRLNAQYYYAGRL